MNKQSIILQHQKVCKEYPDSFCAKIHIHECSICNSTDKIGFPFIPSDEAKAAVEAEERKHDKQLISFSDSIFKYIQHINFNIEIPSFLVSLWDNIEIVIADIENIFYTKIWEVFVEQFQNLLSWIADKTSGVITSTLTKIITFFSTQFDSFQPYLSGTVKAIVTSFTFTINFIKKIVKFVASLVTRIYYKIGLDMVSNSITIQQILQDAIQYYDSVSLENMTQSHKNVKIAAQVFTIDVFQHMHKLSIYILKPSNKDTLVYVSRITTKLLDRLKNLINMMKNATFLTDIVVKKYESVIKSFEDMQKKDSYIDTEIIHAILLFIESPLKHIINNFMLDQGVSQEEYQQKTKTSVKNINKKQKHQYLIYKL
jgi:hypothetical protein